MKKLFFVPLMVLGIVTLPGCATTQSIPVDERTRVYDASYEDVYRATVQAFTEMGYPIDDADKEVGLLNTDWMGGSAALQMMGSERRRRANAMLRKDGEQTRVTLNLSYQQRKGSSWGESMVGGSYARKAYGRHFKAIEAGL